MTIRPLARHAAIVLAVWLTMIVAVTPVVPLTRNVIAFGPPAQLIAAIDADDARLLSAGARSVMVRIGDARSVRALYAGGAVLVLPATQGGCSWLWWRRPPAAVS
jgi:hypothetical protein